MYEQYDQHEPEQINDINWENLADNKCPKCNLILFESDTHFNCTCGFTIHKDRFFKITNEFQNARLKPEYRKKIEEGKTVRFKSVQTFEKAKPKLSLNDLLNN